MRRILFKIMLLSGMAVAFSGCKFFSSWYVGDWTDGNETLSVLSDGTCSVQGEYTSPFVVTKEDFGEVLVIEKTGRRFLLDKGAKQIVPLFVGKDGAGMSRGEPFHQVAESGSGADPAQAGEEPKVNMIFNARSLASIATSGSFDYSATSLTDGNVTTCWSVNLDVAAQEGHYDGRKLDGVVLTLARPQVGTVVVWNGYCKTTTLFGQNARAASIVLTDEASGEVLAEVEAEPAYAPTFIHVDRRLSKGADGSYRMRMDFGSASLPGVLSGSKYNDFCVSEVQVFTGEMEATDVVYPIGARLAYDLRGPVMSCVMSNETLRFERDGCLLDVKNPKFSFSTDKTVRTGKIKNPYADYGQWDVKEIYNAYGILISRDEIDSEYGEGMSEAYRYNSENRLARKEISGMGEDSFMEFTYEDGQVKSLRVGSYNSEGEECFVQETDYTVLEVDYFGNWTQRRNKNDNKTETRKITYY